jgi:hypothetical protein
MIAQACKKIAGLPAEVQKDNGFLIEHQFGDRQGSAYTDSAERAIFWAVKRS